MHVPAFDVKFVKCEISMNLFSFLKNMKRRKQTSERKKDNNTEMKLIDFLESECSCFGLFVTAVIYNAHTFEQSNIAMLYSCNNNNNNNIHKCCLSSHRK